MELWAILFRTIFIYFMILIIMRIMGQREIGKLSVFDVIVSFMIADLSSMAVELDKELMHFILPIGVLVVLQVAISYLSLKSRKLRQFLEGKPIMLIKNGKIQDAAMKKVRYNFDDLAMQLRDRDIHDFADVEYAILETSGKLSVIPKSKTNSSVGPYTLPIPLIIEGKVQEEGLKQLGQNRFWLKQELAKRGCKDFKQVYFASINANGEFYIDLVDKKC
jgi:uncharacterized membrane protein YcaP (DUF421 family)